MITLLAARALLLPEPGRFFSSRSEETARELVGSFTASSPPNTSSEGRPNLFRHHRLPSARLGA